MIENITLAGLCLASFFDLKERELPRILTYGLVIIGFVLNFLIFPENLFEKILSISVCLIFNYGLYKFGIWAGGDFKLFAGISFLVPYFNNLLFFPLIILLFAIIAVFPFALIYVVVLMVKNKTIRKKTLKTFWKTKLDIFLSINFIFLIYLLELDLILSIFLILLLEWQKKCTKYVLLLIPIMMLLKFNTAGMFAGVVLLGSVTLYLFLIFTVSIYRLGMQSFKILQKDILTKKIKTSKLTEGMIPQEDFWLEKGKLKHKKPKLLAPFTKVKINSRLARGLIQPEINFLKKHKVAEIKIKKSMPFVPVILLGFVVLLIYLRFL